MSFIIKKHVTHEQRNGAKHSESEIKNDNFTAKLSFLFNSENSVINCGYLNMSNIFKYE
jgi:hypothetical protein